MANPFKPIHPSGECPVSARKPALIPATVETFAGKVHVNWDPDAAVTPLGQLPFFIEFLKLGGRFDGWVSECPLDYLSNNAPDKQDVLGSLFLSILSGHKRYAHITTLLSDQVSAQLLGMNKIVSSDSVRRALKRIDQTEGTSWMRRHLRASYAPLFDMPWILDIDTTIKPLYGHQEGAVMGYNPHKPGRPSHTYHTYIMANLRLALDVEVQAGDQSHSNYALPGLVTLLQEMTPEQRPQFVRGDIGFGTDTVMSELESIGMHYLFKLRKSPRVKALIEHQHCLGEWTRMNPQWEAKEDELQLSGWQRPRRVVIVRRRIGREALLALEDQRQGKKQLALIEGPEDMRLYEYSVLVTNLSYDLVRLFHHYRDRADCENCFDELKNQWGWCGYTTHDLARCQLTARSIALIYNWWNLYVRLALPEKHFEAITSRPLLLSGIGRMTESGRQKLITITHQHGDTTLLGRAYDRLTGLFNELKATAQQLSLDDCWRWLLEKATAHFRKTDTGNALLGVT